MQGLFDDDAWYVAELPDEVVVFAVGSRGEAASSEVDVGSQAQVGRRAHGCGNVVEELLLGIQLECLAKFGAGGRAAELDHAEYVVGAATGQGAAGWVRRRVGVGAGQPHRRGRVPRPTRG